MNLRSLSSKDGTEGIMAEAEIQKFLGATELGTFKYLNYRTCGEKCPVGKELRTSL